MSEETPNVLIYVPTYNHAKYIEQCLQGIVSQKLSIPFTALVIDDCSTDGTAEVIREYAAKHPLIIKPIIREKNVGVLSGQPLELDASAPTYMAICEGDDFWLDDLKLQKQVDFLETHPECSICFHPVRVFHEDGSRPDSIFPSPEHRYNKDRLTFADLVKRNFIQTNSVLYRWRYGAGRDKLRDVFPIGILPGDWFIHLLHAERGEIGFIDEVMGAYRRHGGGLWAGSDGDPVFYTRAGIFILRFYHAVETRFHVDRLHMKIDLFLDILKSYISLGQHDKAEETVRSREYRTLLNPTAGSTRFSRSPHLLKDIYYYHCSAFVGRTCCTKPRQFRHFLIRSLTQCLLRNNDKKVYRLFSRYMAAVKNDVNRTE